MAQTAKRGRYEWPLVTAIHAEYGAFDFHVHGLRAPSGALTLMVFANGATPQRQCEVVFDAAHGLSSTVVALDENDVDPDRVVSLVERYAADPSVGVFVVPGTDWGLTGAGRKAARR